MARGGLSAQPRTTVIAGVHILKVTDVTPFLTSPGWGKNFCFVRVDTDEGIHGWGECYTQEDRDTQVYWRYRNLISICVATGHKCVRELLGRILFRMPGG